MNDGEDILLADTAEDFANQVARVLGDPALARRLGRQHGDAPKRSTRGVPRSTGWNAFTRNCARLPGRWCLPTGGKRM